MGSEEESSEEEVKKPAAKKPAAKKKDTSAFAALAGSESEEESSEEEEVKKPAAKKKDTSGFAALAGSESGEESSEEEEVKKPAAKKPAAKKGKNKKGKQDDDDEDALLEAAMAANAASPVAVDKVVEEVAALTVEEDSAPAEGAKKGRKRGGKKKKGDAAAGGDAAGAPQTARGKAIAKAMEETRLKNEKEAAELAAKQAAAAEAERLEAEEEQRLEDAKAAKKKAQADKKAQLKAEGKLLTKRQKQEQARAEARAASLRAQGLAPSAAGDKKGSSKVVYSKGKKKNEPAAPEPAAPEEVAPEPEPAAPEEVAPEPEDEGKDNWEDSSDDDWEKEAEDKPAPAEEAAPAEAAAPVVAKKTAKYDRRAHDAQAKEELRSPICCILGHVDTGKTKLLDKIRRTDVQDGEAGGITQQIGVTYFPAEAIEKATKRLRDRRTKMQIKVPGLLIIDTPGHESFSNLRQRGSSLCDIAILVVDITGGLEKQTIESLNLLREKNCPFIVALNKIDRMYDWKIDKDAPFEDTMAEQADHVKHEFTEKMNNVISDFANQGMNACLYTENTDYENFISLVPTSAITGEGIPDLLGLIAVMCQRRLSSEIQFSVDVQATVLEVKVIEGLGTTIVIILINGQLYNNDEIVVCTMNGPVLTKIRALMTPQPMKEIRVKGSYIRHEAIKAAMGIKIAATEDMSQVVAGTPLFVVRGDDDEDDIIAEAEEAFEEMLEDDHRAEHGVYVQASTLGSLEALLRFLREDCGDPIPYAAVNIGPVHKRDVTKASTMCGKHQEHAVILAFDVKIMPEAVIYAEEVGVTIFSADIIYHLFDMFTEYRNNLIAAAKEEAQAEAVFPCVLQIYEQHVFNARNPIVVGAKVLDGQPKIGTPICIPSAEFIMIGRIVSMEKDHKEVDTAVKGDDIAVKIEQSANDQEYYYGRHFTHTDKLVSRISRDSIDLLKKHFREEMTAADWVLVKKLKPLFEIA